MLPDESQERVYFRREKLYACIPQELVSRDANRFTLAFRTLVDPFSRREVINNHALVLGHFQSGKGSVSRFADEGFSVDKMKLSSELRSDKELFLLAVQVNGHTLRLASNAIKDDYEIVLAAVSTHGAALKWASVSLQSNRDIVSAAVSDNGRALEHASAELRADFEIVMKAISRDTHTLPGSTMFRAALNAYLKQNAPVSVIEERVEAFLQLHTWSGDAVKHASTTLRGNRDIALRAVQEGGSLGDVKHFCDDKEIVLAAVSRIGDDLQYASKRLRDDYEVVLAASISCTNSMVENRGLYNFPWRHQDSVIFYASAKLRNNFDFMMDATTQQSCALRYGRQELKKRAHAEPGEIFCDGGFTLAAASRDLKDNYRLVMAAVSGSAFALAHASDELKNNFNVVMAAVSADGPALKFASEELKDTFDIVMAAVSTERGFLAVEFASRELRSNPMIVKAVQSGYSTFCSNYRVDSELEYESEFESESEPESESESEFDSMSESDW